MALHRRRSRRFTLARSRLLLSSLLSLLLLLGSVWGLVGCDGARDRVIARMAEQRLQQQPAWFEADDLQVVLCGTGSPLPDDDRAGPCTAVLAGGSLYLVDIGPGATENLQRWQLPLDRLEGVFLTHFHSDHIGEIGEVGLQSWVAGRTAPLSFYGPPGAQRVVEGFRAAYAFDAEARIAHHTPAIMPPAGAQLLAREFLIGADRERVAVLEDGELRVTAFLVDHSPMAPAVGYRFDYRGRSVVVSGDTVLSPVLIAAAQNADLLVHEAIADDLLKAARDAARNVGRERLAVLASDALDYHTTPVEALNVARAAGVEHLVLSHLVPPVPSALAGQAFLRGLGGRDEVDVRLGEDGMHFRLPGDEDGVIEVSSLE